MRHPPVLLRRAQESAADRDRHLSAGNRSAVPPSFIVLPGTECPRSTLKLFS
ncbi:MAG TPA: hypothetical protein VFO16_04705 [Pseudonocardiaceae bacterium]|nr:hypothetical protein [Pseudonocardiaceae bacterium]